MSETPSAPSVRGTLLKGAVDDLHYLIDAGRVDRSALAKALPAADLELLDEEIATATWYPMGAFARLVQFLWEHEGDRRPEFMVDSGRRSAQKLIQSRAHAALLAKRDKWGKSLVHVMTTASAALYNFMRWTPILSSDARVFSIEVTGAEAWPDSLRYGTEGFIQVLTEHSGEGGRALVSSERRSPDRVLFQVRVEFDE